MERPRIPIRINVLGTPHKSEKRHSMLDLWKGICVNAARLWHWSAKWPWFGGLIGGASIVIAWGEYALGTVLLFLAALSIFSKLLHWNHRSATWRIFAKVGSSALILMAFAISIYIVNAQRGTNPWSHLQPPLQNLAANGWFPLSPNAMTIPAMPRNLQPPPRPTIKKAFILHRPSSVPDAKPPRSSGTQQNAPAEPEPDLHQQLVSGKLALGWTLTERGNSFSIYLIIDTSQLNPALRGAIAPDLALPTDRVAKINALWSDILNRVSAPEPARTEYGIIRGQQEFVEHLSHQFRQRENVEWTYEITKNGSSITPQPQTFKEIAINRLPSADEKTIAELDELTVQTVNRRYIDAMLKISK